MRAKTLDDAVYYHARALEEQAAAQKATSASARVCHDRLASMYRFREFLLKNPLMQWSKDIDVV